MNPTGTHDLRTIARILWRWKWLLIVFLIALPAGAYWLEHGKAPIYESSTLIELQTGDGTVSGVPTNNGNLEAVAALVNTMPISNLAARYLDEPPAEVGSLMHAVSASPDQTTGFITLTAQWTSPTRAAAIATAFARAIGTYQTRQQVANLNLQIRALNEQLAHIPATPVNATSRASVITQIAQLRAERGATGAGAQVLDPAGVDPTPVGPKTRRAVELAVVIGLLAGIAAVLIAENSDRRLRRPEDLEELTGVGLLGSLPNSAFSAKPAAHDEEAFQMLASSLTYFNIDRPIKSLAVASPFTEDGKTTVAVGLARASARSGRRVVLIDADLRRPRICERMGISAPLGLSDVLTGDSEVGELLVPQPCDATDGGSLMVLGAGSEHPNAAALLGSGAMRSLLEELEDSFDLVILDTSPALAVGDALPLFQMASGTVMVVRLNRSSASAVRRLVKVITAAKGMLVGVVATGCNAGPGAYGYGYSDGRKASGASRRGRRRSRPRRQRRLGFYRAPPPPALPASAWRATATASAQPAPDSGSWEAGQEAGDE